MHILQIRTNTHIPDDGMSSLTTHEGILAFQLAFAWHCIEDALFNWNPLLQLKVMTAPNVYTFPMTVPLSSVSMVLQLTIVQTGGVPDQPPVSLHVRSPLLSDLYPS